MSDLVRCIYVSAPASVHTHDEQVLAGSRHSLMTKVAEEPIDQRDFEQWTMGFRSGCEAT